jgi:hypothetical protein
MLSIFRNLKNNCFLTIIFSLIIWATYASIGPGDEFFNGYRKLVLNPTELIPIFGHPIMYNPPWLAPILAPFITMPGRSGYILFIGGTIGMLLYSVKIFKGNAIIALVSAQLFWILWWGQIEGLVILGIALGWFAYQKQSWQLLTIALLLGTLKPQIGAIPLLAIWWWFGTDRWKSLFVLAFVILATIIIYGPWPLWIFDGVLWITNNSQYGTWNSSIGLFGLPLFIPAVMLRIDKEQRLIALIATSILVSPYLPFYSTIILFVFNLPWWVLFFALLGYFPNVVGTTIAWNGIVLLPISILAWLYFPFFQTFILKILYKNGINY